MRPRTQALIQMMADGSPSLAARNFLRTLMLARRGAGTIRENQLVPLRDPIELSQLYAEGGQSWLSRTVCLKLNGGLGTSMGLEGPKSLVPARGGKTFLDKALAMASHRGMSLALMDSFRTRAATAAFLTERGAAPVDAFQQHRVPKLFPDWSPVDPSLGDKAWVPPGHGDLFIALQTSGRLQSWLDQGLRYLFVSNIDNLGAVPDARVLSWMRRTGASMVMEVTRRTVVDRKGGHVAMRQGRPVLRDSAQVHPDETDQFQDVLKHQWFNTNNLWFDLEKLQQALALRRGLAPLPAIVNRKNIDPRDPGSELILQLETAMGAALSWLPNASVLAVPRTRFLPVKTTADLLYVRSDAATERDDGQVISTRSAPTDIQLDSRFYKHVPQLDRAFPHGPPSLRACDALTLTGDVVFGKGVRCIGRIHLDSAPGSTLHIADGSVLVGSKQRKAA